MGFDEFPNERLGLHELLRALQEKARENPDEYQDLHDDHYLALEQAIEWIEDAARRENHIRLLLDRRIEP